MFQVHIAHHLDVSEKVYMPESEATDEPRSELIHSQYVTLNPHTQQISPTLEPTSSDLATMAIDFLVTEFFILNCLSIFGDAQTCILLSEPLY